MGAVEPDVISTATLRSWARAIGRGVAERRAIALRAALAMALTLGTGAALGDVIGGTLASQGCFAALYATEAPYRRRAVVVALMGACSAVSIALATLVADSVAATIAVSGIYAAAVSLFAIAARVGPPREFFPVMTFLVGSQMPLGAKSLGERVALVLAGAAVAWVLATCTALFPSRSPARRGADRALARIADLLDAIGTEAAVDARHHAIVAVRAGVTAADQTGGAEGVRAVERMVRIERLLEAVMALVVLDSPSVDTEWARIVRELSRGSSRRRAVDSLPRCPEARAAARVHAALEALLDETRPSLGAISPSEPSRTRSRWSPPKLGWVLQPPHPRVALRMAIVVTLGLAAGTFGLDRSAWVAMAGAAVLQGAHARVIGRRAIHRAVGTMVGVLFAGAVARMTFSTGQLVAIVVALQYAVHLLVTASYGLATVFVTPLVILLAELAGVGNPDSLVSVRLVDTIIGCGVAAFAVIVTRPRRPMRRLSSAQAKVLTEIGAVLDAAFDEHGTERSLLVARRRLQSALLELDAVEQEVIGDAVWSDPTSDARWPITALVQRAAHLVLTFPRELAGPSVDRAALHRSIKAMARAVAEGSTTELAPPPAMPSLPRTHAALVELHATLCAHARRGES